MRVPRIAAGFVAEDIADAVACHLCTSETDLSQYIPSPAFLAFAHSAMSSGVKKNLSSKQPRLLSVAVFIRNAAPQSPKVGYMDPVTGIRPAVSSLWGL